MTKEKQFKFDTKYLRMAKIWAENSYAERRKVGCLIVKDNMIISDGYNGCPSGFENKCEYIEYRKVKHPYLDGIEVDTDGKIYKDGKEVAQTLHCSGKHTNCKINNKKYMCSHVVLESFVENPDPTFYTQVNHIDYDVTNNSVMNLEWCSNRYNSLHRDARQEKTSMYPGVSKCTDRDQYVASVLIDGKQIHKRFKKAKDAYNFYVSCLDERDLYGIRYKDIKTKPYVLHAEANAITKLARSGNSSEGATLYVTLSPCIECSKLILQSGIVRVVYIEKYRITDGLDLLERAGIEVVQIEEDKLN